jgi:beta-galactosidase GanA
MKAAGFNTTSLYFDWGYQAKQGVYDFTGVRDRDRVMTWPPRRASQPRATGAA